MAKDPIVEEVRAIRAAIAAEHGDAIIRALKEKQGADGRRVVAFPAKRAPKKQTRKAG